MAYYLRKNGNSIGWSLDTQKNQGYQYLTQSGTSVGWRSGGGARRILTKDGTKIGWRYVTF